MCLNATVLKAEWVVKHAEIRRVKLQVAKKILKKKRNFQNLFQFFFGWGHSHYCPQQPWPCKFDTDWPRHVWDHKSPQTDIWLSELPSLARSVLITGLGLEHPRGLEEAPVVHWFGPDLILINLERSYLCQIWIPEPLIPMFPCLLYPNDSILAKSGWWWDELHHLLTCVASSQKKSRN